MEEEKEKEVNGARKMMESIGMKDVNAKMGPLAIVTKIARRKLVEEKMTTQLYHVLVWMVKNGQNLKNLKHHVMLDEDGRKTLKAVFVMEKHMKEEH